MATETELAAQRRHDGDAIFATADHAYHIRWRGNLATRRLTQHGFCARVLLLARTDGGPLCECRIHVCRRMGACEFVSTGWDIEPPFFHGRVAVLLEAGANVDIDAFRPAVTAKSGNPATLAPPLSTPALASGSASSAVLSGMAAVRTTGQPVSLLPLLAFAALRQRPLVAIVGDACVDVTREIVPGVVCDGTDTEREPIAVVISRVAPFGDGTVIELPRSLADFAGCGIPAPYLIDCLLPV